MKQDRFDTLLYVGLPVLFSLWFSFLGPGTSLPIENRLVGLFVVVCVYAPLRLLYERAPDDRRRRK